MQRKLTGFLLAPIAALALSLGASAAEFTPDYLHGVWAIGSQENCGDNETEHLSFAPDGTFKSERFGVTDSVGYWRYKDDVTHIRFFSRTTFEWLAARWRADLQFPGKDVIIFEKLLPSQSNH